MGAARPSMPSAGIAVRGGMLALAAAAGLSATTPTALPPAAATITIDTGTVEGRISPLLYGQFIEFMFEGIKRGLDAELIRAIGASRRSGTRAAFRETGPATRTTATTTTACPAPGTALSRIRKRRVRKR